METPNGAATTAAQIRRRGYYKILVVIIKKAISARQYWGEHTDARCKTAARRVLQEYIPTELSVPKAFVDDVINATRDNFIDTERCSYEDLRACFFVGAISGYYNPAVFGAPYGLDRMQDEAFMKGVVFGEMEWRHCHVEDDDYDYYGLND